MPTYEYKCRECGQRVEVFQKVSDEPLTECPQCKGRLKKVFHPVGIHFKGSGFYTTDHAKKKAAAASTSGGKEPEAKPDGGGEKPTADKPAGEKTDASAQSAAKSPKISDAGT